MTMAFGVMAIMGMALAASSIEPTHPSYTTSADERRVLIKFSIGLVVGVAGVVGVLFA